MLLRRGGPADIKFDTAGETVKNGLFSQPICPVALLDGQRWITLHL